MKVFFYIIKICALGKLTFLIWKKCFATNAQIHCFSHFASPILRSQEWSDTNISVCFNDILDKGGNSIADSLH